MLQFLHMKSLREYIAAAVERKVAIGHFNISNLEGLWGIFNAAKNLDVPVIIGVSEGERAFVGVRQVAALVASIREEFSYPIFLNADHSYSFEKVKEAIDAGFDSVIFDGTKLPFEENVKITKQCVEYARQISSLPSGRGRDVIVEGELGYIGTSSKLLDALPGDLEKTTPEKAKEYVERTGVDLLAPAVGNVHGMLRSGVDPRLDVPLVARIRAAAGVPLVLHGGSGTVDEDFVSVIKNDMAVVHINTEIRVAWRDAMKEFLDGNPDEVAPYKVAAPARDAVSRVVAKRLALFNSLPL